MITKNTYRITCIIEKALRPTGIWAEADGSIAMNFPPLHLELTAAHLQDTLKRDGTWTIRRMENLVSDHDGHPYTQVVLDITDEKHFIHPTR